MRHSLTILFCLFPFLLAAAEMNYDNLYDVGFVSDAFQARCFVQDGDGFIWIGTNKGLCSYDGYNVRQHYRNGAPDNVQIHSLVFCGDSRLYLGTETGLMIYDIRTGKYVVPESSVRDIVRALLPDGDRLWMGTTEGIYVYDVRSGVSRRLVSGVDVYSIVRLRDRIFAGARGGLYCLEAGAEQFYEVGTGRPRPMINALYVDESSNSLWFGSSGLYRLHIYSGQLDLVSDSLSAKALLMDCDGNMVVGTDRGLVTVDPESGRRTRYTHNLYRHNSLNNNVVQSIFRDDNDNIWIGTDYGVSLAQRHRSYEYYSITQFTDGGEGNQFFVFSHDRQGNLWMGGNNGVIMNPLDPSEEVLWFPGNRGTRRVAHNRIRDIHLDRHGRLWLSSDGGLQLYDEDRECFMDRRVVDPDTGDMMYWVYTILEDRKGDFWLSTYNNGIWKVDDDELFGAGPAECSARYTAADGLSGDFIMTMTYNETADEIWSLTNGGGIDIIDCGSGKVRSLDLLGETEGRFPSAIMSGDDENVWIGYTQGLIRCNTRDGSFSHVSFGNGRHLSVTCMFFAAGNIWVCTNEGVWVVSPEGKMIGNFNFEDKVFTSGCWLPRAGTICLGDSDGYASVSPEIVDRLGLTDRLVVSRIRVNGKEYVSPEGLTSRYVDELRLRYDENDISIEIADLSFSNARIAVISYMLGDGGPVRLKSGSNLISLTGLRPGRYEVSFMGGGKVDVGGQVSGSVDLRIMRPPMTSISAIMVYFLCLAALVTAVLHYRKLKGRLRAERAERERTLNKVEEKMRLYSDISHEFKTPLSMILAPVSKMLSEPRPENDIRDLRLIHDSAIRMNQLMHRTLEADKNDFSMELGLAASKVELVGFIRTIFSVFEENQKSAGKEFIFTSSAGEIWCMVDVVKFESIMNNLMSNACKYTSGGDSIIVSVAVSADGSSLEIKVSDTGQGIVPEDLPYIFHRFFRSPSNSGDAEGTGIGLYLVKSYVKMHGGTVSVESEYGQGSTFTVSLPLIAADESSGAEPVHSDERSGLPSVVIVEDNEAIAGFLRELLYTDYRCIVALNGRSGLKLCKEILPDLVITDIMMPVMDGIRMCAELRNCAATSAIPIIVLTAVEDRKYELFSAKYRIDAFITKPFDSNYIKSRVRGLVDKKLEMEKIIRMEMMSTPGNIEAVSADEKLLSRLVSVIEEHITDSDFNVNALCGYLGMSSKSVYRKCVQLLNMTPVEYIRYVRLKKAAVLLEQHDFNVSEVMYMVGFNNHSYFSRCFSREFGKTPQQYKAEHASRRG